MSIDTESVRTALLEATKRRNRGELPQNLYETQISRIGREELEPCGLLLLMRALPDGTTRFLIKELKTGSVRDMIECAPARIAA